MLSMRTRSRGTYNVGPSSNTYTDLTNSSTCVAGSGSESLPWPLLRGTVQSISDVVTPGYARAVAKGAVVNNPMSSVTETRDYELSTHSYYVPYVPSTPTASRKCAYHYAQTSSGSYVGGLALCCPLGPVEHRPTTINLRNLRDLAGTQASAGVDTPAFQGAVFAAELHETIGFLHDPMGRFVRQLEGYKRTKLARKYLNDQSVFDFMVENWLRIRYGVRPVVHDIQDAMKAIENVVHGYKPVRRTSRGTATDHESIGSTEPSGLFDVSHSTERSVSVRSGILYEYSRSPNTFGLDAQYIPLALWEATRLSFVLDWFFNIGSFIEALTPVGGVKQLATWTTVITDSETLRETRQVRGGTHANGQTRVITADGHSRETLVSKEKSRTPGITVGLAYRTAPYHLWDGSVHVNRIADSVALARSILAFKR